MNEWKLEWIDLEGDHSSDSFISIDQNNINEILALNLKVGPMCSVNLTQHVAIVFDCHWYCQLTPILLPLSRMNVCASCVDVFANTWMRDWYCYDYGRQICINSIKLLLSLFGHWKNVLARVLLASSSRMCSRIKNSAHLRPNLVLMSLSSSSYECRRFTIETI